MRINAFFLPVQVVMLCISLSLWAQDIVVDGFVIGHAENGQLTLTGGWVLLPPELAPPSTEAQRTQFRTQTERHRQISQELRVQDDELTLAYHAIRPDAYPPWDGRNEEGWSAWAESLRAHGIRRAEYLQLWLNESRLALASGWIFIGNEVQLSGVPKKRMPVHDILYDARPIGGVDSSGVLSLNPGWTLVELSQRTATKTTATLESFAHNVLSQQMEFRSILDDYEYRILFMQDLLERAPAAETQGRAGVQAALDATREYVRTIWGLSQSLEQRTTWLSPWLPAK